MPSRGLSYQELVGARPGGLSVMMLNRDEERRLREIERSLKREDPEFVGRITRFGSHRLAVWANGVVAVGVLIAFLGVLSGSPVSGFGVLLAVVGLALRLSTVALEGLPQAEDDGGISK